MTWPFENDTSAVEKKLASRSIRADKRRSVFVILTIALAVCLMGTLCFLYSAQQMKTLDGILGQYQAGCGGLTREEVVRLADTGRFEKWGCTIEVGTARHKDSILQISYVSPEMIDLMGYGRITGAYPQRENELCVERPFFRCFGLSEEIGQTVALDLGDGEKSYTVTGILESENFVNATITNFLSRRQEIEMLQAIGLSKKQLIKMLCYEGSIYSVFATLVTLVLGTGLGLLSVQVVVKTMNPYFNYSFPWLVVLIYLAILLIVQFILISYTTGNSKRRSLVEQVRAME